jgi:2-polyprenyl-3-methyl-5-hydroxy-6-metoxy-1,4-benzoquinol methylase
MKKVSDERYVPWSSDYCTGVEHLHRYALAQEFVKGKKVLDLASGEGYGSARLAAAAASVVGVDICKEIVAHAAKAYRRDNLRFLAGSMCQVPIEGEGLFDVIVCFEALEHIEEHAQLLSEVKRLLKKEGVFLVSTPNKPVYTENGKRSNKFHLKELDLSEFRELLQRYFKHQSIYAQKTYAVSKIFPHVHDIKEGKEYRIDQSEFTGQEDLYPRYFIGLASDAPLSHAQAKSYLFDITQREGFVKWQNIKPVGKLKSWLKKVKACFLI